MKYTKDVLIIIAYLALVVIYVVTDTFSYYLFYATLQIELILLILLFPVYRVLLRQKSKVNYMNVIIGSIPLVLLNFFLFSVAGLEFDGYELYEYADKPALIQPIFAYSTELLFILAGILLSHLYHVHYIRKENETIRAIEAMTIKQGFFIWVLGLLTIAMDALFQHPQTNLAILLPISRICLELWFMNMHKKEIAKEN